MHRVFFGLGANVGDKEANIRRAAESLRKAINEVRVAPLYESRAAGYTKQDNFFNTAVEGYTRLGPKQLLGFVKEIETRLGRIERFRWGPREIDIDILFYNKMIYKDEELEIPHPRLHERDFVLRPLADLVSEFIHPVFKKTIKELLEALPPEVDSITQQIDYDNRT